MDGLEAKILIPFETKNVDKVLNDVERVKNVLERTAKTTSQAGLTMRDKFNKAVKDTSFAFQGWALSVMFFGFWIQRTFQGIATSALNTFNKVMSSTEGVSTAVATLSGWWDYLKFTVGNALNTTLMPLLPAIISIIEKIVDWINEHPKLTAQIIIGAVALGFFLFMIGQLGLAIPGFLAMLGLMSLALGGVSAKQTALGASTTVATTGINGATLALTRFLFVAATLLLVIGYLFIRFKSWKGRWAQVVIWGLRAFEALILACMGLGAAFTAILDLIVKGIATLVNYAVMALNKIIDAANLIPGVNIPHIPYWQYEWTLTKGMITAMKEVMAETEMRIAPWQEVAKAEERPIFNIIVNGGMTPEETAKAVTEAIDEDMTLHKW